MNRRAALWMAGLCALSMVSSREARAQPEPAAEVTLASADGPLGRPPVEVAPLPLLPELCLPELGCPPVLGAWKGDAPDHFTEEPVDRLPSDDGPLPELRLELNPRTWPRKLGSMVGTSAFYGALYTWAYFAWYRGRPQNDQFTIKREGGFGPQTYAGGADKLGHYYSSYAFSRLTADVLIKMGWRPWVSVLVGSVMSMTWFTTIEFKDAYHKNYGFSPEDMVANTLGVLTSVLMVLWPAFDNLFDIRLYYRPSKPFSEELVRKRNVDLAEDYTGSTYLLALRLMAIPWIRNTRWARPLRYVDLMVGYNARGFLPRPANARWRDRELFFGFGLNLVAILEDVLPGSQAHRSIAFVQEYLQLSPISRLVRARAYNPQPYKIHY